MRTIAICVGLLFSVAASAETMTINILEHSARKILVTDQFDFPAGQKKVAHSLRPVGALKGVSVGVYRLPVKVDGRDGFQYVEMTLTDSTGKILAYGNGTFPTGSFTIGSGFRAPLPPNDFLVITVDTTANLSKKAQ